MSIVVDFNVVGGVVDNVVISVVVSVVCGDVTVGIFNVSSDPDFSLAALTTTVVVPSVEALLFFCLVHELHVVVRSTLDGKIT